MATSIGGTACSFLKGNPPPPRLQKEVVTSRRPGVDGMVAEKLGLRGGPFMLRATKLDTAANVQTWLTALDALVGGSPVTVETDDGETYTNCYITRAEFVHNKAALGTGVERDCLVMVHGDRSAT